MTVPETEIAGQPGDEHRWRRTTATVLLFLLFFSAALANVSVWLQTTISNTDDFVSALAPVPDDASVAQALGEAVANATVDPQTLAQDLAASLPDELQGLALPIASAANQVAANIATRVIESDGFEAVWTRLLQATHTALLDFLNLRSEAQRLLVDIHEAAEQVASRLQDIGIDVTVPDEPNLTLIQTTQSPVLINLLRFVYTTGWVFPALFLVLLAGVIWLRTDRRAAVRSVGIITATAMLFDLILMRILRADVSDQATDSLIRQAIRSAWDTVTTRLRWQTWIVLVAGLVVAGVAHYVGRDSDPSPALSEFLQRWGTWAQVAVVGLALVIMLAAPSLSIGLAILIAAIAAVVVFVIELGKQPSEAADV